MNEQTYEVGQRWAFSYASAEYESQLVVGESGKSTSSLGIHTYFLVYIPFTTEALKMLPPNRAGLVLSMSSEDLDRHVTNIIESDVDLPFWWKCGFRVESPDAMPYIDGILCCTNLQETLPERLAFLTEQYAAECKRRNAVEKQVVKFKNAGTSKRSASVAESWKRIEAFMNDAEQRLRLNDRATPESIDAFEKLIGLKLPSDFRESLEIHDGGDWWVLPNFGEFLPIAEITQQWSMYKEWQEKDGYGTESGDWKVLDSHGPIKPIFWNSKRIPISDNSGDHLMLDLDPPEDGNYGQILDHSHEVGPERIVASSWSEFLANLVNDLENGKYVADSSGYIKHVERA